MAALQAIILAACQPSDPSRAAQQEATDAANIPGVNVPPPPAPPHAADAPGAEASAATPADSARLVQLGSQLFQTKGCRRCHTIGEGYRDGPDLEGATDRRTYDWIVSLLTNTEEMIQTDPDLQQLRIEHFLDMPNLEISPEEARALFFHLRAASAAIRR